MESRWLSFWFLKCKISEVVVAFLHLLEKVTVLIVLHTLNNTVVFFGGSGDPRTNRTVLEMQAEESGAPLGFSRIS